jgi:phospholipid/cholesterol/gamma-HCH transport system substrate-binding protein
MTQLNATLAEASGVLRSLDGYLDQEGRQVLQQAVATMNSLQRSSRELETLLVDNRDSLESGMQGLAGLGPMLQDLGEALGSLRTFSRRLEEDPSGYLLRRDTLQEFRP